MNARILGRSRIRVSDHAEGRWQERSGYEMPGDVVDVVKRATLYRRWECPPVLLPWGWFLPVGRVLAVSECGALVFVLASLDARAFEVVTVLNSVPLDAGEKVEAA